MKRPRQSTTWLIPEMFIDPWISNYSLEQDAAMRARLTRHLSSASRESVEARAFKFENRVTLGEEIVLHF